MHSFNVVTVSGQSNGSIGAIPSPAPRSILASRARSYGSPRAAGLRVRFNRRTYVADALENGDWREIWPKIDKETARAIREDDYAVLYGTEEEREEKQKLDDTKVANEGSFVLPEDNILDARAFLYAEDRGLDVVDDGEGASPVRADLPDSVEVEQKWLKGTGVEMARTTSIYEDDVEEDATRGVHGDLMDRLAAMMLSKLSIDVEGASELEAVPALVPTTEADDAAEVVVVGPLTPPDEKGTFEAAIPEVSRPPLTRQKSSKGKGKARSSSFSGFQTAGFSSAGYSVLDGF
ncbi:hypothetical protein BC629DRAFT_1593494 [Irpex lacteus]|nr:hypothetical protein BC629DRAFT_1593494 [Irpex lacteus]